MAAACAITEKRRKPDHVEAEEAETDALDKRRERRVSDESPIEMARVREELQLVAMKAVAAIGEDVEEHDGGGDGEEDGGLSAGARARTCFRDSDARGQSRPPNWFECPQKSTQASAPGSVAAGEFHFGVPAAKGHGPRPCRRRLRPGCPCRCPQRQGNLWARCRGARRRREMHRVRVWCACSPRSRQERESGRADELR